MYARRAAPLLLVLLSVSLAADVIARDFLIQTVSEPESPFPIVDSGQWMHNDVLASGEHMMGFVREVQGDEFTFWEVVMADDARHAVAGQAFFPEGSFVSVGVDWIGNQSVFYQDGLAASGNAIAGQVLKSALSYSNSETWYDEDVTVEIGSYGSTQYPTAVGQGDNRWIAYFACGIYGEGPASLYAARPNPGQFETELVDPNVDLNRDRGRVAAIDIGAAFQPGIVYVKNDNTLFYAARDGSSWTRQPIFNVAGQRVSHVDLEIDGAGTPHVSFYILDTQDLMYATRDLQGNWNVELAAFNGRPGRWSSIALDPAGVPHITAYRTADKALILVQPAPGNTWEAEAVDTDGDVGEFSSLAIDSYGKIHIAYRDKTNRRAKYATWFDWNGNGVHDDIDIDNGLLQDCDGNGIVDSAEILRGYASDCDLNGIPDHCEEDCDQDGTLDTCQIAADPSLDCNGNATLDACDIGAGALDCDADGVLDTCEIGADLALDCDGDGTLDACQIASGFGDCDADGILDSCQSGFSLDVPGTGHALIPAQDAGLRLATGDVNGDGSPDLIFSEEDEINVLLGGTGFDEDDDMDVGGSFEAIAVGDVDGDGLDDLIIGNVAQSSFARSFVRVYRSTGTNLSELLEIDAPRSDVDFGTSIALLDVDGDGLEDIVVGAPGERSGDEGFVYVYSTNPLDAAPEQTWSFGIPSPFYFGGGVADAGDLDGNGIDDVMVSVTTPGFVVVYLSQPGGSSSLGPILSDPSGSPRFGRGLAGVGDVNDDGFDDVVIGDPSSLGAAAGGGVARLYLGGSPMDANADLVLDDVVFGTAMGSSIAGGLDLNGDTFDDLLVGSRSSNGADRGAVQVYFGGPTLDADADVTLLDEEEDGGTGVSVLMLGDVNGDGIAEFAYGAPSEGSDGVVRVRALDLPDFGDCNANGIRDACDIASGEADVDLNGVPDVCENVTAIDPSPAAKSTRIVAAIPTPFNPRTTITFELSRSGTAELTIYNAAGRNVGTLVREHLEAGTHSVVWNARTGGPALASGVYFAVLRTQDAVSREKIILLK